MRSRQSLPSQSAELRQRLSLGSVAALVLVPWLGAAAGSAADPADGLGIAQRMEARDGGTFKSQEVEIVMRDRRGKERSRHARIFRREGADRRRTALFYESPANVRGTGFLTVDYTDGGKEDDQWLYLPSLKRVRRISASERGDWFMATDLTYEDVKKDGKFEVSESEWSRLDDEEVDGNACYVVEGRVKNADVARQLGHAAARVWVDQASDYPRRIEYRDAAGEVLRTVHSRKLEQIQGVWTALLIEAQNHTRGTRSTFHFRATDYQTELSDQVFSQAQLQRGAPR